MVMANKVLLDRGQDQINLLKRTLAYRIMVPPPSDLLTFEKFVHPPAFIPTPPPIFGKMK